MYPCIQGVRCAQCVHVFSHATHIHLTCYRRVMLAGSHPPQLSVCYSHRISLCHACDLVSCVVTHLSLSCILRYSLVLFYQLWWYRTHKHVIIITTPSLTFTTITIPL